MRSQQRILCEGWTVRFGAESASERILVHFVFLTGSGIAHCIYLSSILLRFWLIMLLIGIS